eukprot:CAMPEP_0198244022 /NCGR_PEP_ID=MMETSP1446-20131203/32476_1 /TAXON_ID=1461542 ORGANISM="Unidentified sp, Strain CCMP2111" /NCGR_SAMPLE_ID=MMETSP1446 /ASSEMBLY_ACC=CAM_ASM_001112 /LENGTH=138 /DNA_ID=CAMNT_0043927981 /DNA_START=285 /DNA_END=701 /DNA_ORIENTATION=+
MAFAFAANAARTGNVNHGRVQLGSMLHDVLDVDVFEVLQIALRQPVQAGSGCNHAKGKEQCQRVYNDEDSARNVATDAGDVAAVAVQTNFQHNRKQKPNDGVQKVRSNQAHFKEILTRSLVRPFDYRDQHHGKDNDEP